MAIQNITKRKLRSFLTLLGIIIGVASIVATVSIGLGLQERIIGQLSKFMANMVTIIPGNIRFGAGGDFSTGKILELTTKDEEAASKIDGVEMVTGEISSNAKVEFGSELGSLTVYGVQDAEAWKAIEADSLGLESGRFITNEDNYAAVIGNSVAHEIFSKDVDLRKTIKINGVDFRVVGILNSAGGFLSMFDQRVYIPMKPARELFSGQFEENEYASIAVKIADGYDTEQVAGAIESRLLNLHHQTEETRTFSVISSKFFQDQISSILSTMTIFLGAIGAISLVVGGIGIMNIMYVSVMERTREIGIMKAIGATNRIILLLFLFESGIFGLLGGAVGDLFGTFLGVGITFGIRAGFQSSSPIGQTEGSLFVFSPELWALGVTFGLVVGLLAGFFPARRASKLNTVEALRYE